MGSLRVMLLLAGNVQDYAKVGLRPPGAQGLILSIFGILVEVLWRRFEWLFGHVF